MVRGEQQPATIASLTGALVEARPAPPTVDLPGRPQRLALAGTIRIDEAEAIGVDPVTGEQTTRPINPAFVAAGTTVVPVATLRDGRGLLHQFSGGPTPIAAGGWQFVVPLSAGSAARRATTERLGGGLTLPLSVVGVDLVIRLPGGTLATAGRVGLDGLAMSEERDGSAWRPLDLGAVGGWVLAFSSAGGPFEAVPPSFQEGIGVELDGVGVLPGVDRFGRGAAISFTPSAITALARDDLAAIVNRPFLEAVSGDVGDRVFVPLPGGGRRFHIVGVVDSFPTTDPARPAAMVDVATLGLLRFGANHAIQLADEWWFDVDDASPAATAAIQAARAGGPLAGATVTGREDTREQLSTDPLALATIGALSLGFVVAGLFAVIGLTVSAAVSARQRRTEFALLRALGLSPDQLSGWLLLENGSLVLVSLIAGTALGLLIGWVVLPFITVTQGGAIPFPPVSVEVPWSSILVLEVVSVAALAITLVVLARSMRRAGVGSVLRMGED